MTFWHRALLRGMLAGAVVLTGTACSRSDRTESGSDTSAARLPDTTNNPAQPSGADTATGAVSDTAAAAQSSSSTQPSTPAPSNSPRAETVPGDEEAAGYRSMDRDTTDIPDQPTDSARVTSPDTSMSESSAATSDSATVEMSASGTDSADTSAAGYVGMARDTSTVVDQADTAATSSGDVAVETTVDTSSQDSAEVRTETDVAVDEAADETADEQIITAEEQETVVASETRTDEVGAAAIGGDVTGAEAVALTTREGVRCAVADPEANEAVRWDMSSTPVTLNPCGMGSMILSRIWTEK